MKMPPGQGAGPPAVDVGTSLPSEAHLTNNPSQLHYARSLIEASLDPMATISVEGRILDVNAAVEGVIGRSREELVGTAFSHYFTNPAEARSVYEQAFAEGQVSSRPLTLRSACGSPIEMLFNATVYHDERGEVAGVLTVARDITEIKRAEDQLRAASHYARSLLEASLDPLVTISPAGKIMEVNRATERATGLSRDALIGSDFSDYFTEPEKARAGYQLVFSQGHVTEYPLALRHTSGSVMEVLYNASLYFDEGGRVAGVFAAARDVTQLKRSQEELESTNREISLIAHMTALLQGCQSVDESLPILAATMQQLFPDTTGRCFLLDSTGHLLEEATVWGGASPDTRTIDPADCWALRRGHIHDIGFDDSINSINPPCRFIPSEQAPYLCLPLLAQGAVLGIIHLIIGGLAANPTRTQRYRQLARTAVDSISLALANLRLRESLHEVSIRDPLTGLYNRRFMEENLTREISRMARVDKSLAVAMLDLDYFKDLNDTCGHEAGDAILREVGRLMMGFRQGSDMTCRYGGEEFLLVLSDLTPQQAWTRLDAFRLSVCQISIHLYGQTLPHITVSIGLAVFPEHGRTGATLIKAADEALYRAKENGRNRIEVAGLTAGKFPGPD